MALLDDFLMNPLNQGHSGTSPEASRNALSASRGKNEDNSQSDPHPEAGIIQDKMTYKSGPQVGHDMVIGVHEEVTDYSFSTTSGKQKKNHSTSQLQFYSENTPATIEAD